MKICVRFFNPKSQHQLKANRSLGQKGNVPFRDSDSLRSHAVRFASQASLGQKGKLGAKRH